MKSNSVFETIRVGNEVYVFYDKDLIYKKWVDRNESMLFNSVWGTAHRIPKEKDTKK